jgi:hypothetical protein
MMMTLETAYILLRISAGRDINTASDFAKRYLETAAPRCPLRFKVAATTIIRAAE